MSEITFYHNPNSRGRVAHWMLEEVGQPYKVELIDTANKQQKSPEYLKLNPMGKLPTIVHRNTVITEAAAICAYLADAFPEAKLAPALNDPARGTYFRWLFFAAACGEPAAVDRVFPRAKADPSVIGYGTYDDTYNALEQAVSQGKYVLGDQFTAADVYIASLFAWGLRSKIIEPRPAFTSYLERTQARPALKRSMEQNERFAQQLKR